MSVEQLLNQTCFPRYDYRAEHFKDLLREAHEERLARLARGPTLRFLGVRPHLRQALLWLGRRLTAWGWHLEERYGARA